MKLIKEWIEEKITNGSIPYFEYDEFSEITEIGSGKFGQVFKASTANMKLVALKVIINKSSKEEINEADDEFTNELNLLHEVGSHPNIDCLLGITKDSKDYILVLEYANNGNLMDYLKEKFASLNWNNKIKMALDITSGLEFLHSKEIIHRDLHSKNILVNNGKLLIADFGLSKKLVDANTGSVANIMGIIGYIEPLCFSNKKYYKKDKKSDIYSLGVLLWEISSGRPPFSNYLEDKMLTYRIRFENLREEQIENTPQEYRQLYEKCWNGEPKSRPDTSEVYRILSQLSTKDFSYLLSPQHEETIPSVDNTHNSSYGFHISTNFLKIRNLLIIGRTLSGKTTLSSVLCDTDDFKENGNTVNETENLLKKDFECKGTKYYVIEIGVGSIKKKDFYNEIIELMPEGISQVLFVVDKSFTTEEKQVLELYKKIIFESGILEYVTIVRNKFENFRNKNECEKDIKNVFEENEIIIKIVKSCNNIIHIDNPPTYIYDDSGYKIAVNRNAREESKNILLNYLEDVCREKYYKLVKWDDLHSKINSTESNKNFAAKLEKADITISTGIKTNNRAQQWFNETYSKKENIDISESKNLKLKGFLEIKDFTKLKSIILKNFELNKLEISGCSQLDKIDLSELTKLTSLSLTDCQKLTGLDCSSTKLSSLKIINCPQLNKIIDRSKTKTKSLYARGYSNLSTLDCLETGFTILEINGCSQLNEVDLSKLPKITSLSVIDCSNLSNLDCSSTGLTSLKISGCYRLEKFGCSKLPKLTSLSVIDCLKLTKLDCSNSEITDLEVSDLTELNCSNTSIKELSLNLCPYITKLDCSNNKNLKNLDISNCLKLESINCSNSKLTGLDISYCPELEEKKIPGVAITRKKENVKNILIVGRAGGGKSTLANVLTNTDEFKESAYAVSETKIFRKKEFKWNEINFRVVDTIGAGDTKLSLKDILYKIVDGIYAMPEGISQMLYVVDGRITGEEISTFNMFEDSILQDKINIFGYVTLVRTKFDNFKRTEECKRDKEKLLEGDENIAKIVRKCNDVIHVDNPPINSDFYDDDDDVAQIIKMNKNNRQKSRQKLLEYLEGVDPVKKNKYFKLKTWDKLRENISEYVKNNEDALKRLENEPELEAFYNASKGCLIM